MKRLSIILIAVIVFAIILVACNGDNSQNGEITTNIESDLDTEVTTDAPVSEEATTTVEEESTNMKDKLNISESSLSSDMKYLFSGNSVKNDTLFFIDKGEIKRLLYPATKIISVTSYDGKVTYTEGRM